jgi:hypothetical protein
MILIATALPELPPIVQQQPVKSRQQQLLERIMQQAPAVASERAFGDCTYQWGQWKLSSEGIRTTQRSCKGETATAPIFIAVSCSLLQVNINQEGKWTGWRSPVAKEAKPGEALMVATLCANAAQ